jgi:hypothetical protein
MRSIRHCRQVVTLGFVVLLAACVTEPGPAPKTVQQPVFNLDPQETDYLDLYHRHPTTQSVDVDRIDEHLEDPDATQMHDIGGALLVYYRARGYFPEKLDELLVIDPSLKFVSVRDGKPYGYDPEGRAALKIGSKILVYSAEPIHGVNPNIAARWCIFWDPPEHTWESQSAEVRLISEGTFRTFN